MIILLIRKNWKKNEFTLKLRWMRWNIRKPPPQTFFTCLSMRSVAVVIRLPDWKPSVCGNYIVFFCKGKFKPSVKSSTWYVHGRLKKLYINMLSTFHDFWVENIVLCTWRRVSMMFDRIKCGDWESWAKVSDIS